MSGFTSFLKKLGQVLAVGLQVAGFPGISALFGSAHQEVVGLAINDFTAIGTTIIQMETALQGKSGVDKLKAASTLVMQIVKTSELVAGHQIGNEAEFIAGNVDLTNAVVRILNSLKADGIKTSGPAIDQAGATPATPTPAV